MNNLQLFYQTGLPMLLILIGIVLNERNSGRLREEMKNVRGEIKDVRGEIKDVRGEIKDSRKEAREASEKLSARIDRIDHDLAAFYKITGVLEGRLDEIAKR